jgi:hypothetical protein
MHRWCDVAGRRLSRTAALMVAGLLATLCFASSAMAGSGTLTANCNYNWQDMLQGPHVRIESGDLQPLPGYTTQWVTTKEYLYNYETKSWTSGDWNTYLADRVGKVISVGGPDFWLGHGWYAAYVVAYAWNPSTRSWGSATIHQYVPYEEGGWWCHGT